MRMNRPGGKLVKIASTRGTDWHSASRIVLPYILFGAAWILFSDRLLLPLAASAEKLLWLSTAKGWFFVSVTAFLLATLVLREFRKRGELEARLRESLAEKEALLRELHHRVKNNLQVISSILDLERDGIRGDEARLMNGATRARLLAMSLAHEQLHVTGGIARVELAEYLRGLVGTLPDLFGLNGASIDYDCDEIEVGPDTAMTFGLYATESVSNALRHGAGAGGAREVSLSLRAAGPGAAEFVVRDRGPGIPVGAAREGLGFRLMEALAGQLRGELSFLNEGGAVLRLRFPIAAAGRG